MHRLTAPKKNTCEGMRLIYIIYVNLGKTGFVECIRTHCIENAGNGTFACDIFQEFPSLFITRLVT